MNRIYHENDTMNDYVSVWEGRGQEYTHPKSLQVYPVVTEHKPYITGNPKATCGTASGNSSVGMGGDLEDGIYSDCEYRCVYTSRCC